ncbi:MAG: hypothetical protein EOO73_12650 [Myxococcales bacterium]|nr:MAG: hypothetical protein EOO73_12650 [Myxococcales bacterium]
MRSRPPRVAAAGGVALSLLLTSAAHAEPRWNAGLETGVCWSGDSLALRGPGFCSAAHADVLFLRESGSDFGVGPSIRLGTARFDDVRLDGGLSVLVPLWTSFPLVLEAGPHLRNFHQAGVFGSVFFGLRSFNHYGRYDMATGLSLMAERSFADGTPSAIWLAARVDAAWLALPFVLGVNALR